MKQTESESEQATPHEHDFVTACFVCGTIRKEPLDDHLRNENKRLESELKAAQEERDKIMRDVFSTNRVDLFRAQLVEAVRARADDWGSETAREVAAAIIRLITTFEPKGESNA